MCITINAIESYMDIADCMTAEETREVTLEDENLGAIDRAHTLWLAIHRN